MRYTFTSKMLKILRVLQRLIQHGGTLNQSMNHRMISTRESSSNRAEKGYLKSVFFLDLFKYIHYCKTHSRLNSNETRFNGPER